MPRQTVSLPDGRTYIPYADPIPQRISNAIRKGGPLSPGQTVWVHGTDGNGLIAIATRPKATRAEQFLARTFVTADNDS